MFSKSRMDAFTDAVIAIVLTMMSLSIPTDIIHSNSGLYQLFFMIGIYLVSFCFIASIWYQRSVIFSHADDELTHKIVFYDIVLLFFLSLTPIMTKLMIDQIDNTTVTLYGLLVFIIFAVIHFLRISILKASLQHENITEETFNKVRKIEKGKYLFLVLGIIVLLIIGVFLPIVSFILYLIVILETFMMFKKDDYVDRYSTLIDAFDMFNDLGTEENEKLTLLFKNYQKAKKNQNRKERNKAWNDILEIFEDKFNLDKKEAAIWAEAYKKENIR